MNKCTLSYNLHHWGFYLIDYSNILAKIVPNQSYSLEMLKSLYSHIYHMSVYFEQFLFSVVDTHDFQ